MRCFIYSLILMFSCASVQATTVDTWSGAGPNACMGVCTQEWAMEQLTDEERDELRKVMEEQPEPQRISIQDGDVFSLMSYQKDGEPVAYRTSTIAALTEPEYASGWHLDGWSFVRLDACQNWAIVRHGESVPVYSTGTNPPFSPTRPSVPFYPISPPTVTPPPVVVWPPVGPPTPPVPPVGPPVPPPSDPPSPPPPIPPVPLPAPILLLASACGALGWFKMKGQKHA